MDASSDLFGMLKIGVSAINATRQLLPILDRFMAQHPDLQISLLTDDRRQDLILEQADVAIRFGHLPDTSMRARRLGTWPLVIAGAPGYLAGRSPIREPADLESHEFIVAGPMVGRPIVMFKGDRKHEFTVKGRLSVNSSEVSVSAACAGLGLSAGSTSALEADITSGRLVRVLPDWEIGALEGHALFPGMQPPSRAARAFVDFLVEELAK